MSEMRIPVATYRLQLNRRFRFEEALRLVPYLHSLGISDIYASPILKSRKGSLHGYDVVDPTSLNLELGTEVDFEELAGALKDSHMGLLLDIVPNHMAASQENPWWQDFLDKGQESPCAGFFDIDWLAFGKMEGYTASYRRFFDIGDLVGMRVENPEVFQAMHSLILRLIAEGRVTGLRIDHIDGLYDPLEYLTRLQEAIRQQTNNASYVVVEKILSVDETLPEEWPVSGTTGYEFASTVNALFIDRERINTLDGIYSHFTGKNEKFVDVVYEKKKQVMDELFSEETKALGRFLARIVNEAGLSPAISPEGAAELLIEITACLPVYRTYTRAQRISPPDREYLEHTFREVQNHISPIDDSTLAFLKQMFYLDLPVAIPGAKRQLWLQFILRWQQLTGAIMAKGVEDTALYNYSRLISLNEVGGVPDSNGFPVDKFHDFNLSRMEHVPHTMNASSTHDTKRSEDVRARINVLSEIPAEWEEHLIRWEQWNASGKLRVKGSSVPEPDTEILLYQTMLGAWPLDDGEIPNFEQRLKYYMLKAVKEAKSRTSWVNPDKDYEDAIVRFIEYILDDSRKNVFLDDFRRFQKRIAYYGALNSLAQVLLKVTSPGVPDFYQGTELWDFSLVDPDNRRPVDFEKRADMLVELTRQEKQDRASLVRQILDSWEDGRIKLYLTHKSLTIRNDCKDVFQNGQYVPLKIGGANRENICAFARCKNEVWIITVVPRLFSGLVRLEGSLYGDEVWANCRLTLPVDSPTQWENVLTGEQIKLPAGGWELPLASIFHSLPVALLKNI